eukprot:1136264-Pelagomonas_calceolata.AAC.6
MSLNTGATESAVGANRSPNEEATVLPNIETTLAPIKGQQQACTHFWAQLLLQVIELGPDMLQGGPELVHLCPALLCQEAISARKTELQKQGPNTTARKARLKGINWGYAGMRAKSCAPVPSTPLPGSDTCPQDSFKNRHYHSAQGRLQGMNTSVLGSDTCAQDSLQAESGWGACGESRSLCMSTQHFSARERYTCARHCLKKSQVSVLEDVLEGGLELMHLRLTILCQDAKPAKTGTTLTVRACHQLTIRKV